MAVNLVLSFALAIAVLISSSPAVADVDAAKELKEAVLTLDVENFSEVVAQHPFIVVEFYAPWCGHCKELAPEYEKAASVLRKNDPPVVLAKVDAYDERNKELKDKYGVYSYPTIKIIKNRGSDVRGYGGPREADSIVEYLRRQVGPASLELRSAEDVAHSIGDKGVILVGIFPEFAGREYENFMAVAEKMRADYNFFHTSDASILPRGEQTIKGPIVRLFKPFDELFVDSQDFGKDALEKFIEVSGFPMVVTYDADPTNHKFLERYYSTPSAKAMLFVSFNDDRIESFKSQIHEAARQFSANNISFLIGDVADADRVFQYFGLRESDVPLLFVIASTGKYLNPTMDPDQIIPWLKQYIYGNLTPYVKSEPIPEVNDQPVKVVVADNIDDIVFNSGKNVLLEFYAPWCGHCRKFAPILEEIAVSLQDDQDIVIAKMDGTANDIPTDFAVDGYPTLYFYSSSGNLLSYEGARTAEEIISFINENRGPKAGAAAAMDEKTQTDAVVEEPHKVDLGQRLPHALQVATRHWGVAWRLASGVPSRPIPLSDPGARPRRRPAGAPPPPPSRWTRKPCGGPSSPPPSPRRSPAPRATSTTPSSSAASASTGSSTAASSAPSSSLRASPAQRGTSSAASRRRSPTSWGPACSYAAGSGRAGSRSSSASPTSTWPVSGCLLSSILFLLVILDQVLSRCWDALHVDDK